MSRNILCFIKESALAIGLVFVLCPFSARAQGPNLQIDVDVPVVPVPTKAENHYHLVYELHVTNFGERELTLWRVEVQTGDREALAFASYENQELSDRIIRPGQRPGLSDKRRIEPGMRAILFLWLSVDARSALPSAIFHRLTFSGSDSTRRVVEQVIEISGIKAGSSPVVIGPPLRGGGWLAANGPSDISVHRRALVAIEGRAQIAQRFAIDWVKVGDDGKTWRGDRLQNISYYAYGAEAIAVADGVVSAMKDGIPENVPGPASRAVQITSETIAGNYVMVDLGAGRFAFYAHLQPSSIRVRPGDKVRRGQVLGLVGNSGNSTEPHLHFHVSDGPSPLGSEGLPYVIDSFETQNRGADLKASDSTGALVDRRGEMPLQNAVVRFKEPAAQPAAAGALAEANPADVASVDSVLAALYDVISGPAGKARDWSRFRSLFMNGARLIPVAPRAAGGFEARANDVEGYIKGSSPHFEKNGFFEKEIARRTESYGRIAQVFSTYELRRKQEDKSPFARGINSIQLMNDGTRWWIVNILWQQERPEIPIPKQYLKGIK